jgi:hypothetical protein
MWGMTERSGAIFEMEKMVSATSKIPGLRIVVVLVVLPGLFEKMDRAVTTVTPFWNFVAAFLNIGAAFSIIGKNRLGKEHKTLTKLEPKLVRILSTDMLKYDRRVITPI